VRHDPSVPQFYAQREMIGLERKAAGLGRSGDLKKSMSQAQKRKHRQIVVKSGLLSKSGLLFSSSPSPTVSTALTNSYLLNQPHPKRRRLSADKSLVVLSEIGTTGSIENINMDSIPLGRWKRQQI
jgi:hypothetical protein